MAPPAVAILDPHGRIDAASTAATSGLEVTTTETVADFRAAVTRARAGCVGIVVHCKWDVLEKAVNTVKERSLISPLYAFFEGVQTEHEMNALEMGADAAFPLSSLRDFLAEMTKGPTGASGQIQQTSTLDDGHFYMKLAAGDLPSVVQFLGANGRAGELRVEFKEKGTVGQIFTGSNMILHAAYESRTGLEAIVAMLVGGPSEVHFFDGRSTELRSVSERVDQVLLTTTVMADEFQNRP